MSTLDRGLRREFAKAVATARKTAEAGALNALTALMVAASEPDSSLSGEERALRRRLRAHGRQLGDERQGARQKVSRLAHEIAYEHWHRMLFARFLAENSLLVEPKSGISVSLDECRELGRESGKDAWTLAGDYAAAMLPQIFRPDDPSLAVRLPPETQRELEETLDDLHPAVFAADDALGWTYQFWQTNRKKEVNERVKGGAKIGADELPAVTQLFTEPYMVRFLFHNTVGAWRAGHLLAERSGFAEKAGTEDELRDAVRLNVAGGYDFDYLRFVREPEDRTDESAASGPWRPAAGSFEKWPTHAAELRILDPCCGSGHFLVEGLHLLVRLRMEEEGLSCFDAIRAVLRDNLHGLEIDPRCAQIAAFAVAFAAWKLAGEVIDLPPLRIACSGLVRNATKEQWLTLAERAAGAAGSAPTRDLHGTRQTLSSSALRHTFEKLHGLFADAPTLGSLIDPRHEDKSVFTENFDDIHPLLDLVLAEDETDAERKERAVAASGIAEASSLLAGTYSLVITNVPYLARGKQGQALLQAGDSNFPTSKRDLATMFLERGLSWLGTHGIEAFVVPQKWLFLTRYRALRDKLLTQRQFRFVAWLGPRAFETIGGHVVDVALAVISGSAPVRESLMATVDAARPGRELAATAKASLLHRGTVRVVSQGSQRLNPDSVVLPRPIESPHLLSEYADSFHGISTKDYPRFGRHFWEVGRIDDSWTMQQSTVEQTVKFGGLEHVLFWEDGKGDLDRLRRGGALVVVTGLKAWSRNGVAVSQTGEIRTATYVGTAFDDNTGVIVPKEDEHLAAIICFCSSREYSEGLRRLDPSLKVTYPTLVKVPFDLPRWKAQAREDYPHGLPEPFSDEPTQWVFHGHPCGSVVWNSEEKRTCDGHIRTDGTALHVAVTRLLGYRWPAEHNREMCLADQQLAWVERCADLDRFADQDGIVCLPAVRGEEPAAGRLRKLLVAAYGGEWSSTTEQHLLRATSGDGRPTESLEDWLRRRFFAEHCGLFRDRPFVWHIWDGLPDGFSALVNYHRLASPNGGGRSTLEALTYSYLGDWIDRQRSAQEEETAGADARLAAALDLQQQLEHILQGEPPFDLFIRWKPLHRQPLGWEPDINDGVRLNIRPFMRSQLRKTRGRQDAGCLRANPKSIQWDLDRGKEPRELRARRKGESSREIRPKADFPWFWSCPGADSEDERTDFMGGFEFDGKRWNDLHYTLAAKRAARERHERDAADKPVEDAVAGGTGAEGKTA